MRSYPCDPDLPDPAHVAAYHEAKGDVCARHLDETLAKFVRENEKRYVYMPSDVEIACREIEGLPK
jgi:hypothetical protein